jgi:hypothetical protein
MINSRIWSENLPWWRSTKDHCFVIRFPGFAHSFFWQVWSTRVKTIDSIEVVASDRRRGILMMFSVAPLVWIWGLFSQKDQFLMNWIYACINVHVHLFHIQADPDTGWEIDSQTTGYRMCHISEQVFQLIIGTNIRTSVPINHWNKSE